MYCSACGTALDPDVSYCNACGSKVGQALAAPAKSPLWWLPVAFLAILFIRPIILLVEIDDWQRLMSYAQPPLGLLILMEIFGSVALAVWGSVVAFHLFKRRVNYLSSLKTMLIANFAFLVCSFVVASNINGNDLVAGDLFRSTGFLIACFMYFKYAGTVKHLYGKNM